MIYVLNNYSYGFCSEKAKKLCMALTASAKSRKEPEEEYNKCLWLGIRILPLQIHNTKSDLW